MPKKKKVESESNPKKLVKPAIPTPEEVAITENNLRMSDPKDPAKRCCRNCRKWSPHRHMSGMGRCMLKHISKGVLRTKDIQVCDEHSKK